MPHSVGYRLSIMVLAALLICGSFWPVEVLSVKDRKTGAVLLAVKRDEEDTFIYSYLHSVSRTQVREHIRMTPEGQLVTYKVMFKDQSGAGLPEYVDEKAVFTQEDEWMVIDGLQRMVSPMQIHVNEEYLNRIHYKEAVYDLFADLEEGKGSVLVELTSIPYIVYLLNRDF